MTPEETKKAAEVMLAAEYDESGKCKNIQIVHRSYVVEENWHDNPNPKWDWESCDYRIKPKPELKKGQIIEVSDTGRSWRLRRFSRWLEGGRVFAYDGSNREQHYCVWKLWRLPE